LSSRADTFKLQEEKSKTVKDLTAKCKVAALCIVAPFAPLRIAPKRSVAARFSIPDEFVIEEFVERITEGFPEKKNRPPLYLLIHSPGGTVSSSYVVARVLRKNFEKIIGFVPHIAASGATVMALSCNELVMGNISRLTGIDPSYETDGETIYPLSIVRAFQTLETRLRTKTLDEISYPYQHLVESISGDKLDEATNTLKMVEQYATELMENAGYDEAQIKKVIAGVLYEIHAHEEVITADKAKKIGIKVVDFNESANYLEAWKVMRNWLKDYYLKPSPIHIIRYCLPPSSEQPEKTDSGDLKKGN